MNGILIASTLLLAVFSSTASIAANPKDWTLLVFLNGHNNLDQFGGQDIKEMETSRATNVNVVVQWASLKNRNTLRMNVQNGAAQVVQTLPTVDMGDYRELIEFIRWGVANYPAKHYFIDVWNHGTGWHNIQIALKSQSQRFFPTNISSDDLTGNSITTQELGLALKEAEKIAGKKVDIYGSDACLMQMIEVAYEVSDHADFILGSEDLEPATGWDYSDLLSQNWGTPVSVGKRVVDGFVKTGGDVQLSLLDSSLLPDFVSSVKLLQADLRRNPQAAISAAEQALQFDNASYVDIGDFPKRYRGGPARTKVENALKKVVIYNRSQGSPAQAQGISVWMPTSDAPDLNLYRGLKFHRDTQWGDTLSYLWNS
jgi:hypothetical protein